MTKEEADDLAAERRKEERENPIDDIVPRDSRSRYGDPRDWNYPSS